MLSNVEDTAIDASGLNDTPFILRNQTVFTLRRPALLDLPEHMPNPDHAVPIAQHFCNLGQITLHALAKSFHLGSSECDQPVDLISLSIEKVGDTPLLVDGRQYNGDFRKILPVQPPLSRANTFGTGSKLRRERSRTQNVMHKTRVYRRIDGAYKIVRAHKAEMGRDANGTLPGFHLVDYQVAYADFLVARDVLRRLIEVV